MSADPPSDLPPFCRRSSIEIAADVGAAAKRVLEVLWEFELLVPNIARGGRAFDSLQQAAAEMTDARAELLEELAGLGSVFDQVAGWWIADTPPAIDPTATSVAEAIISSACDLVARIDVPGITDVITKCRCVEKIASRPVHPVDVLEAALRCEVAVMSRRPPPAADVWQMWSQVAPKDGIAFLKDLRSAAAFRVRREFCDEWEEMSQAERTASVEGHGSQPPPSAVPEEPREKTTKTGKPPDARRGEMMRRLAQLRLTMTYKEAALVIREEFGRSLKPSTLVDYMKKWKRTGPEQNRG